MYTEKQIEKAMIKFYENIRNNPENYVDGGIEEVGYTKKQAIEASKELISYIK